MRLREKAKDKLADVFVRLGETTVIAGFGSVFFSGTNLLLSLGGFIVGIVLIVFGIAIINRENNEETIMLNVFLASLFLFVVGTIVFIMVMRGDKKEKKQTP